MVLPWSAVIRIPPKSFRPTTWRAPHGSVLTIGLRCSCWRFFHVPFRSCAVICTCSAIQKIMMLVSIFQLLHQYFWLYFVMKTTNLHIPYYFIVHDDSNFTTIFSRRESTISQSNTITRPIPFKEFPPTPNRGMPELLHLYLEFLKNDKKPQSTHNSRRLLVFICNE